MLQVRRQYYATNQVLLSSIYKVAGVAGLTLCYQPSIRYYFSMEPIQQALLDFFRLAARKDQTLFAQLRQTRVFTIDKTHWQFTLPDLYHFLYTSNTAFVAIDYKEFRRLLFNSPVNELLKDYDAEIVISENKGKVDESRYSMAWHSDT